MSQRARRGPPVPAPIPKIVPGGAAIYPMTTAEGEAATALHAQFRDIDARFGRVVAEAKARLGIPAETRIVYDPTRRTWIVPPAGATMPAPPTAPGVVAGAPDAAGMAAAP